MGPSSFTISLTLLFTELNKVSCRIHQESIPIKEMVSIDWSEEPDATVMHDNMA